MKELGPAAKSLVPRITSHLQRQLAHPMAHYWDCYTANTVPILTAIGPDAREALPLLEQVLTMEVKGTSSKEEAAKAIAIIRGDAAADQ